MGFYRDLIVVGFTVSLCVVCIPFIKRRVKNWIDDDKERIILLYAWFLVQLFFCMYIGTVTSWLD